MILNSLLMYVARIMLYCIKNLIIFMKEAEERGLYFTEKIKNMAYNAKFKAMKYFEEYNNNFLTPGD